jgi:hypothetical protein
VAGDQVAPLLVDVRQMLWPLWMKLRCTSVVSPSHQSFGP